MMKSRPILLRYLAFFLYLGAASAQGALSGPSLGSFFDPQGHALRRIWGIPGSAVAGENLDLGFSASQAIISPPKITPLSSPGMGR